MIHDALLILWDCSHTNEAGQEVSKQSCVIKGFSCVELKTIETMIPGLPKLFHNFTERACRVREPGRFRNIWKNK